MALLFLKSVVLPHRIGPKYTPLPIHATDSLSSNEKNQSSPTETVRISPRLISDATIGLSDGLTVPFALTAGLSALGDSHVVIYGGLAELIAGAISMGLGGYLGARGEADAYAAKLAETRELVKGSSSRAQMLIGEAFEGFEIRLEIVDAFAQDLQDNDERTVDFLMKFRWQLAEIDFVASRAYVSGLTISGGYLFGGLVPLLPYLFLESVEQAFVGSLLVMMVALFAFGWIKTALIGERDRWTCGKNGVQMVVLGSVAAGAAMLSVKALSG
ncbi:hypothetical protein B0A48_02344 [Cryoendolithus antarcticus]|uniref:Protein CCC1 n=1 Tax=Cryoendolithus antarcticus TaxID=1507870 RepID=A0A1V8TND4_9PEZI|nr:hypothetical protein B0A48_02344 [Cryoendolithus antarcticus]